MLNVMSIDEIVVWNIMGSDCILLFEAFNPISAKPIVNDFAVTDSNSEFAFSIAVIFYHWYTMQKCFSISIVCIYETNLIWLK